MKPHTYKKSPTNVVKLHAADAPAKIRDTVAAITSIYTCARILPSRLVSPFEPQGADCPAYHTILYHFISQPVNANSLSVRLGIRVRPVWESPSFSSQTPA